MFERFTERARQVVVLAQEEARKRGQDITPSHLVAGLIREEEGMAAKILAGLEIDLKDLGLGEEIHQNRYVHGQIPITPEAKTCLELALREALSLGHNYIGTEHVLLGVVRNGDVDGLPPRKEIREAVIEKLVGRRSTEMPPKAEAPSLPGGVVHVGRVSHAVQETGQKLATEWAKAMDAKPSTPAPRYRMMKVTKLDGTPLWIPPMNVTGVEDR